MIIEFFVPGHCQAKQRPFVTKTGTFTRKQTVAFLNKVALFASQAMKGRQSLTDAIRLEIVFILPRPKAHFDSRGEIKDRYKLLEHTKRPDLDNLIKSIKDACNKIIWNDDSQIYCFNACYKRYQNENDQLGCLVRVETTGENNV